MKYFQSLKRGHPCTTGVRLVDLPRTRRTSATTSSRTAISRSNASAKGTQPTELCAIKTPPGTEVSCKAKAKSRPMGRDREGGKVSSSKPEKSRDMPAPSLHGPTTESQRPWAIELLSGPERRDPSATWPSIAERRTHVDVAVHHTPAAVWRSLGPAGDNLPCRAPELEPRPVQASVLFHVIVAQVQASWHILSLADSLPACCRRSASGQPPSWAFSFTLCP